eukprot:2253787-Prymnesium_polylepis.2
MAARGGAHGVHSGVYRAAIGSEKKSKRLAGGLRNCYLLSQVWSTAVSSARLPDCQPVEPPDDVGAVSVAIWHSLAGALGAAETEP